MSVLKAASRHDAIQMAVIASALSYVAEEMGILLKKVAYSPNIKERMDHSCAIFDNNAQLVAQAEHIPVHLGSMQASVQAVLDEFRADIHEGDAFLLNDPYKGGTHLPDLTFIAPVFCDSELSWFTASRAHHADVGGKVPGSMASDARDVYQEGFVIPPVRLMRREKFEPAVLRLLLQNVRTPQERLGDLRAQFAAAKLGAARLIQLARQHSLRVLIRVVGGFLDYSEQRMRAEIQKIPHRKVSALDYLDDSGVSNEPVKIRVAIEARGTQMFVDYDGTDGQVGGSMNAVKSVTLSGVYFVIKSVTDPTVPSNSGAFRPIHVTVPEGCVLNPRPPAAVAGGNVETSQRNVDVLFRAFAKLVPECVYADCSGSMNNVLIGGIDPRNGRAFTYYETIAGGMGGRYGMNGVDGVHTNMTNTANTPVEALEAAYPLRVTKYEFRNGSAGIGRWRGGMGIIREYEILTDSVTVTLFGDRQKFSPQGVKGGLSGKSGRYFLERGPRMIMRLPSKASNVVKKGDRVRIETAGGGGYGTPVNGSHKTRTHAGLSRHA